MEPTTTTVVKAIPIPNSSSPPPTIIMRRDRDASFSSYLKPHHLLHHNHQIDDLDDDDESTTELSIFDAHKYFNSEDNNNNNNEIPNKVTIISNNRVSPLSNIPTHDDTTIAPEKAVNTVGTTATATRYSSASSSVDGGGYRARSLNGTATPSEASWNSQAGLLSHTNNSGGGGAATQPSLRDSNGLNKKLKDSLSKPIWILRRKCPCRGKKSVQVKEYTTKVPQPPPQPEPEPLIINTVSVAAAKNPKSVSLIAPNKNWVAENVVTATNSNSSSKRFHTHRVVASTSLAMVPFSDGFTFPVLNAKPHPRNGVVSPQEGGDKEDDQLPRDSLEVFQPPDDVEPTSDSPEGIAVGGGGDGDEDEVDDGASDASSDLFEIESFSTGGAMQPTCPVVFRREPCNSGGNGFFYGGGGGRRRSMDEGSTATMTECYEPSEASVEWSVTTAEGCYEESIVDGGGGGGGVDMAAETVGEKWKKKAGSSLALNGGLLIGGCRSEKAVSVGRQAQPVRKFGGGGCGQSGATCGSRHVNVKNMNVIVNGGGNGGSRVPLGSCNKPPLPHHHNTNTTPCISLAFAT
ncbi:hypothetical protein HN51_040955 [Arachis hypogaea]|uniref:uncharacterized protein n=1 Tax=Arachis hypogaea TaxID=3818 RepID=UPI000DEC90F4|nr:protein PHYTOCHROME KINASE SUBSTRATE 4 [Arachis hypogaea]